MAVRAFSSSHRRILVLAATAFFITSVYLCVTRLFAMSFTRETFEADKSPQAGQDEKEEQDLVRLIHADLPMSYGEYKRPSYDDITLLENLPEAVIPTIENGRRLVIVGDIHGMDVALNDLLKKVQFNETTDHLIAAGDMISKGPDTPAVLSRLMSLNASAVRGNHEDRVLLAQAEFDAQIGVSAELAQTGSEERRGELQELVLARGLSRAQLDWLAQLPVVLTADPLQLAVVHAGLVPGVALKKQDPWAVMHMRTITYPREHLRSKEKEEPRVKRDENPSAGPSDDGSMTPEVIESLSSPGENSIDENKAVDTVPVQDPSAGIDDDVPEIPGKVDTIEEGKKAVDTVPVEDSPDDDGSKTPEIVESVHPSSEEDGEDEIDTSHIPFDRTILVPIDTHEGDMWSDVWNKYQKRVHRKERRTVVYGHDAKTGYKEGKFTYGIDSDCARGGALTALIVRADKKGGFKTAVKQVKCHKA